MWITPQLMLIVPNKRTICCLSNKCLRMDHHLVTETLLSRSNSNNDTSAQRCAIEPCYTFGVDNVLCWTHLLTYENILKVFAELWDCNSCSGVASLSQLSSAPNYYRACGKYSVELLLLSSAQSVTH